MTFFCKEMMNSILRFSFLQNSASSPTSSPSKRPASTSNSPSNLNFDLIGDRAPVEVQSQKKVIVQEDVIQPAKNNDRDEEMTIIAGEDDVEEVEEVEDEDEPQVLGKPTSLPDLLEDSSLVEVLDFETLEEEIGRMKVSGRRTFYDRFSSCGQEYKRGDACLVKGSNNQSFVGIIVAIWLIDQDKTTPSPSPSSTSISSLLQTPYSRSPASPSLSLSPPTPNGKPRRFVTISDEEEEDDSLRRSKRLKLDPEVKNSFSDLSPRTPSHFLTRQLTKRERIQNRRKHVFFLIRWFFEPQDTYLSKNAATFLDYGYIHPQELFLGMTATDYQTPDVLEGKAIVKSLTSNLTDHQVEAEISRITHKAGGTPVFFYRKLYNCTYNAFHPLPSSIASPSRLSSRSDFSASSTCSKKAGHSWINQEFERALKEQEKKGDSNFFGFFSDFPNTLSSSRLEWIGAGEEDKRTGKVYYEAVIWRGVIFSLGDCAFVNTGKKTIADWILRIFELFSHKGEFKYTGQWFYTNDQLPFHLRRKMDKQELILSESSDINDVNSIIGRCEVKHQSVRQEEEEIEETFEEGEGKLKVGSNKKGYKYSYRWFYDLKGFLQESDGTQENPERTPRRDFHSGERLKKRLKGKKRVGKGLEIDYLVATASEEGEEQWEPEWVGEGLCNELGIKEFEGLRNAEETNGAIVEKGDYVFLLNADRRFFVARVLKLWENAEQEMMITCVWFYSPHHTIMTQNCVRNSREIYASLYMEDYLAEAIVCKCEVHHWLDIMPDADKDLSISENTLTTALEQQCLGFPLVYFFRKIYSEHTLSFVDAPREMMRLDTLERLLNNEDFFKTTCLPPDPPYRCPTEEEIEWVGEPSHREGMGENQVLYYDLVRIRGVLYGIGSCAYLNPVPNEAFWILRIEELWFQTEKGKGEGKPQGWLKGSWFHRRHDTFSTEARIAQMRGGDASSSSFSSSSSSWQSNRELFLSDQSSSNQLDLVMGRCVVKHAASVGDLEHFVSLEDHYFYRNRVEIGYHSKVKSVEVVEPSKDNFNSYEPQDSDAIPDKSEGRFEWYEPKLRILDLFAGCGGFSTGLEEAGMKVTWAVEWDPSAAATFMRSHPNAVVMNSDVELILEGLEKKDRALPKRGEIDVIIGGPPCQGFSQANRNRNVEDDRNQLVGSFFRFVAHFEPKYLLMENVLGMIDKASNNGEAARTIYRVLVSMGYQVRLSALQAAHYGAPQSRWRVIVFAAKRGLQLPIPPPKRHTYKRNVFAQISPDFNLRHESPNAPYPFITLLEAIGDCPAEPYPEGVPGKYFSKPRTEYQRDSRVKSNKLLNHWTLNYNTKFFTRLRWAGCFNTVLCGPRFKVLHPSPAVRRLVTIREIARAQGFPDKVLFVGTTLDQWRQIGNAVPTPLGRAVGRQVLLAHEDYERKRTENLLSEGVFDDCYVILTPWQV